MINFLLIHKTNHASWSRFLLIIYLTIAYNFSFSQDVSCFSADGELFYYKTKSTITFVNMNDSNYFREFSFPDFEYQSVDENCKMIFASSSGGETRLISIDSGQDTLTMPERNDKFVGTGIINKYLLQSYCCIDDHIESYMKLYELPTNRIITIHKKGKSIIGFFFINDHKIAFHIKPKGNITRTNQRRIVIYNLNKKRIVKKKKYNIYKALDDYGDAAIIAKNTSLNEIYISKQNSNSIIVFNYERNKLKTIELNDGLSYYENVPGGNFVTLKNDEESYFILSLADMSIRKLPLKNGESKLAISGDGRLMAIKKESQICFVNIENGEIIRSLNIYNKPLILSQQIIVHNTQVETEKNKQNEYNKKLERNTEHLLLLEGALRLTTEDGSFGTFVKCGVLTKEELSFLNNILTEGETIITDSLFEWHIDKPLKFVYYGSIKQKINSVSPYAIEISNRKYGHGTQILDDGKMEGNWTDEGWDRKFLSTIYYQNGSKKTGYFEVGHRFDQFIPISNSTNNWIYLGADSVEAQVYYSKKIEEEKEYNEKISKETSQQYQEMLTYIENNQTTILSKLTEEKQTFDGGYYKTFKFEFSDGVSGELDYYKNSDEWCTQGGFFETKQCYKSKGKALCRLHWKETH